MINPTPKEDLKALAQCLNLSAILTRLVGFALFIPIIWMGLEHLSGQLLVLFGLTFQFTGWWLHFLYKELEEIRNRIDD